MPFFIPHPKYDIQNVLEQQQPEIFISYNFIVNSFKASPPGCATLQDLPAALLPSPLHMRKLSKHMRELFIYKLKTSSRVVCRIQSLCNIVSLEFPSENIFLRVFLRCCDENGIPVWNHTPLCVIAVLYHIATRWATYHRKRYVRFLLLTKSYTWCDPRKHRRNKCKSVHVERVWDFRREFYFRHKPVRQKGDFSVAHCSRRTECGSRRTN